MIGFYVMMWFLLYTHITIVIPKSAATIYTYTMTSIHAFCWVMTSTFFVLISCRDPGYLTKQFELIHLVENFHSDDICPRC